MFTIFPNLPSELRVKIWHHACFPRTMTLTYSSANDAFHCTSPPPVLLSTTHESREEALRIYTMSFGTKTQPARTYFNPYKDTVYLPRHGDMGYDETLRDFRDLVDDPKRLLDEVRSVAIDHVNVDIKRPWESYNKAALVRGFKNLTKVIVVLNSESEDGTNIFSVDKEVEFLEPKADPECLLRIWYCFRQSFMLEEKVLEDVCRESGSEYVPYVLPVVRIRSKALKAMPAEREVAPDRASALQGIII